MVKAIYAGSFNPFHIGHKNIVEKAERMFDRVIIAYGRNPGKTKEYPIIPTFVARREHEAFEESLPSYLLKKGNPVLIRGIRDSADLEMENKQLVWIKKVNPAIEVVYIPCDPEFRHISSSAIRSCVGFPDLWEEAQKYIV